MQDLGLILPQAYDQGLFRFQDRKPRHQANVLSKALERSPWPQAHGLRP